MSNDTATYGDAPRDRTGMNAMRKTALWAGVMYLLTFVSIPTVALYSSVLEPGYISGPGPDTGVLVGGLLELIVGLAGIGTAVVLYPVVKRQNEGVALGFVGTRVLEAATIFLGVAGLWTIVTLRQGGGGADLSTLGDTLVGLYDRAFLVGQSLIPSINAFLLGSLMYRSRLVPRFLPVLGFIGAVVLLAYNVASVIGLSEDALAVLQDSGFFRSRRGSSDWASTW